MGNMCRHSKSSSRGPETGAFILCFNGRDPQIYELWCWDNDGIFREVHPTARVDILAGTVREFVTKYLSENERCYQIIDELLIYGSVQFIGLSQIWGSGLLHIVNLQAHIEAKGWCSSSNGNPDPGTSCSITVTEIWGERFIHSTVNFSGNRDGSVNDSPDYFLRSPNIPRVARRRVRKDFLCCRRHYRLCCKSNCRVC